MRRREVESKVPVRLNRFDPDEWPDAADVYEAFAQWSAARDEAGIEDGQAVEVAASLPDEPWDEDAI